jgi:hypothetical protein
MKCNQGLVGEATSTSANGMMPIMEARLLTGDSASSTENSVRGFKSRASKKMLARFDGKASGTQNILTDPP